MKIFTKLSIVIAALLVIACSNNDDNDHNNDGQTTLELLVSGRWYQESKSPGSFSSCEKNSYIEFSNETDIALHFYNEDSGPCESEGVINATYTLSNNNLVINASGEIISVTIDAISENELIVTSENETIVFDKIEG